MIGNKDYAKFDASSKLLSFYIVCLKRCGFSFCMSHFIHALISDFNLPQPDLLFNILYDGAAYKVNSFIMIYMIYCRWQDVSPYKPQVVSELGPSIKLMEHLHFGEIPAFLWLAWFM